MRSRFLSFSLALLVTPCLIQSATAQDATGKKKDRAAARNNPATFVLKQLKDAALTDEQEAKVKELAKETAAAAKKVREEAGVTPEIMKKRAAVQKEMRDSGKKPQEIFQAVNEKAGLTKEQSEAIKKANQMRTQLLKKAYAMLSEDQQAKLPERVQKMATRKGMAGKKGKGKGKKKDAKGDG
ncbi:MAG: hypothetical protein AAFV88_21395 [Planctomycetota bacterium]